MSKKIKIAILADAGSTHTVKWVNALSEKGLIVHLISLRKPMDGTISNEVDIHVLENQNQKKIDLLKLSYFKQVKSIKKIVKTIAPDILHAYYATSYGALGRYCKHPNYMISVWGSDIYEFPNKSPLHRFLLKRNLSSAGYIFSTSFDMMEETKKYTSKPITVIPFGVDVDFFSPQLKVENDELVFGTVKTMEHVYGIDILIWSFAKFCESYSYKTKLMVAGSGSQLENYKDLAKELGVDDKVDFLGYVEQKHIPELIQKMDVFMVLSRRESFGVAAVEAAACSVPVIASDTGGLPEVVEDGKTGLIVPVDDIERTVNAMQKLTDPDLRKSMGIEGRKMVFKKYEWKKNVDKMMKIYEGLSF